MENTIPAEIVDRFLELFSQYKEAKKLIDSNDDPVTAPYKSKYAGIDILKNILNVIDDIPVDDGTVYEATKLLKMVLRVDLGIASVETEESSSGELYLKSALSLLETEFADDPRFTFYMMTILNQLAYIRTIFADHDSALECLVKSENFFKTYTTGSSVRLSTAETIFTFGKENDDHITLKLENLLTETYYFMAQVYQKLNKEELSAEYCLTTLQRQIKFKKYNPVEWSTNAATLAQYFSVNQSFRTARRLIAAAKYLLQNIPIVVDEDSEDILQAKADVNRILAKYCMTLLEMKGTSSDDKELELSMESHGWKEIESSWPFKCVTSMDEANRVFVIGRDALKEASNFLTIDEHASDHVDCVMETSKLFRLLANHETDEEKKCKMHRRRIDMLEQIVSELNPKFFLAQTRQILFELGETYSEMATLKMSLAEKKDREKIVPALTKINKLITKATENFNKFLSSFKDEKSGKLPDRIPEDYVRPFIVALFSIGRLHSKITTGDPREQLKNWSQCEEYYKRIVEYLDRNCDQKEMVREELQLVEEMLKLIPQKLNNILNSTMH